MKKMKKRYVILVGILFFVGLNKLYDQILIQDANKQIEGYIVAQGLEKEEKIRDTGIKADNYLPFYFREIIYKKNPKKVYSYYRTGRTYWDFNYYLPFYGINRFLNENKDIYYSGVELTISEKGENGSYLIRDDREGQLDKKGKLIQEILWTTETE